MICKAAFMSPLDSLVFREKRSVRTSITATDERPRTTNLNSDSILKDHESFRSDYRAHTDKKKLNDKAQLRRQHGEKEQTH